MHDDDLSRVCVTEGSVKDYNFADLPPLMNRNADPFSIPSLQQVFETFPDVPINIDIKTKGDVELIHKTQALIEKFNRKDRTFWGSFHAENTKIMYNHGIDLHVHNYQTPAFHSSLL
jgi:hypothetical protein